jgi:hypothetical protein
MIGTSRADLKPPVATRPRIAAMCMQCMLNAMAASAGATGARSWLGHKRFTWLTPARLRLATIVLISAALFASATLVSGSSSGGTHGSGHATAAAPSR